MLPAVHRLRASSDFATVTKRGHRVRCGDLVVYLLMDGGSMDGGSESAAPARVGLVVGKSVGGSVVRHRVSRRLRAQLSARLADLPTGSRLVVRALPDTATRRSTEIGRDLDRALVRLGRLTAGATH